MLLKLWEINYLNNLAHGGRRPIKIWEELDHNEIRLLMLSIAVGAKRLFVLEAEILATGTFLQLLFFTLYLFF